VLPDESASFWCFSAAVAPTEHLVKNTPDASPALHSLTMKFFPVRALRA
jgi:hypothetical protein